MFRRNKQKEPETTYSTIQPTESFHRVCKKIDYERNGGIFGYHVTAVSATTLTMERKYGIYNIHF